MKGPDTAPLERYADRGNVRGADAVWREANASALPDYLDESRTAAHASTRRIRYLVLAAAALVVLLGTTAVFRIGPFTRRADAPSSVDAPNPTSTYYVPSPEESQEADRRAAELEARGWRAWIIDRVVTPGPTPPKTGYAMVVPFGYKPSVTENDSKGFQRVPIYDQPDGTQIGYIYSNLGFVHKDKGDDPTFDVAPLYRAAGTCAPTDQECAREMNRRALESTAGGTGAGHG